MNYKRMIELMRDQFDLYMEPAPHYLYINKKALNFEIDDFLKEALSCDSELKELWNEIDEDTQEETLCDVAGWIDIPTEQDIRDTKGCDRYHAWKDGDRDYED